MKLVRTTFVSALLFACHARESISATSGADGMRARAEPTTEARSILVKMNERYANAKTYRDEGTYRDAFRDLDGTLKETRGGQFKTRWRAPDRMLFVLQDGKDVRAVWSSSDGAKELLEGRTTERESLDLALAAMQGVTHGLTKLVPRWLLDRGSRRYLSWTVRGRVPCSDNHECWHLDAPREDGKGTIAYFVDTESFALRRFTAHTTIGEGNGKFIVDDEVNLIPVFDEPMPDYELAFDPMMP
jgi:hypothetical protein